VEQHFQIQQLRNPDYRISFEEQAIHPLLNTLLDTAQGVKTGDDLRWSRSFWEIAKVDKGWIFLQSSVNEIMPFGGRSLILDWSTSGIGMVRPRTDSVVVGRQGVLSGTMRELPVTLYSGEHHDSSVVPFVPKNVDHLLALWTFCSSSDYHDEVRKIEKNISVTTDTLAKIPFHLAHWQKVATERYPHGLPKPFSSDPKQWLFNGHPKESDQPLHVAVARLLGYQWPRQTGSSFQNCSALGTDSLESFSDSDGIVCFSATKGEAPAAERIRALLAAALGSFEIQTLLASAGPVGSKSDTLDAWLRDEFFDQHCALFHHRPFIWHIWDGHKSGFSALVNYHQLTHAKLENLTYAYLGDWLRRQQAAVDAGEAGSDSRLAAAKQLQSRLKLILNGEPPFDLFVRWKPLSQQAIGWNPDLNDGVRMNIRPFLVEDIPGGKKGAGILRSKPNIKWEKDRGKEPARDKKEFPWFWGWDGAKQDFEGLGKEPDGNRWNDLHYSNDVKNKARLASKAR
jgi:hypothetical protein